MQSDHVDAVGMYAQAMNSFSNPPIVACLAFDQLLPTPPMLEFINRYLPMLFSNHLSLPVGVLEAFYGQKKEWVLVNRKGAQSVVQAGTMREIL